MFLGWARGRKGRKRYVPPVERVHAKKKVSSERELGFYFKGFLFYFDSKNWFDTKVQIKTQF
jgi:hypothetical protein